MRVSIASLLVALGAAGVIWLLRTDGSTEEDPGRTRVTQSQDDVPAWMRLKTGTLTLRVTAPDGSVPQGAQVGYDTPKGERLHYVNPKGARTLTDVPLGDLTVVAQAPGFELLRRAARVNPGVTEEIVLQLTPSPLGPNR